MPRIIIVHYEEDPESIVKFRKQSAYMWTDHITFTRDFITSVLAGLDDVSALTDRLNKNQEDIGGMIEAYYGKDDSTTLINLLKTHISTAGDAVQNAKAGKSNDDTKTKWQDNAKAIADFLDSLDSTNWPAADVLAALNSHMDLTMQQISARVKKDWVADIAAYDKNHQLICKLADVYAQGITNKFPEKFVKYDRYIA